MTDTVGLGFVLFFFGAYSIAWAFVFRYSYVLWKLRKIDVLAKRHPAVILLSAIVAFIGMICRSLVTFALFTPAMNWTESIAANIFFINVNLLAAAIFASRLWLLLFDFQLSKDLLSMKWKQRLIAHDLQSNDLISETLKDLEMQNKKSTPNVLKKMGSVKSETKSKSKSNVVNSQISLSSHRDLPWTIKYGKFLGNWKYIVFVLTTYWLISVIIQYIVAIRENTPYANGVKFVLGISILILTVVVGICAVKVRKSNDTLGIQSEFKGQAALGGIVGTAIAIIVLVFGPSSTERLIGGFITIEFLTVAMSLYMVLQVEVVLNKYRKGSGISKRGIFNIRSKSSRDGKKKNKNNKNENEVSRTDLSFVSWTPRIVSNIVGSKKQQSSHNIGDSNVSNINSNNNNQNQMGQAKLTLQLLLTDEEGFELFAQHLVTEFSIENLLFLLEFNQVLYLMHDINVITKIDDIWSLQLPSKILNLGMNHLRFVATSEAIDLLYKLENENEQSMTSSMNNNDGAANNSLRLPPNSPSNDSSSHSHAGLADNNSDENKRKTKFKSKKKISSNNRNVLNLVLNQENSNQIDMMGASDAENDFQDESIQNEIFPFLQSSVLLRYLFDHYISFSRTSHIRKSNTMYVGTINIGSPIRNEITKVIEAMNGKIKAVKSNDKPQIIMSKVQKAKKAINEALELFGNASKEVQKLLSTDSMLRFRTSKHYKEMKHKLLSDHYRDDRMPPLTPTTGKFSSLSQVNITAPVSPRDASIDVNIDVDNVIVEKNEQDSE